ncbi:hypothetical protein GUJ93_ZPchr0001g31723 [Zizania palustris]|uniref:Uncharacterized protein n=1 Tax=Zizania palustris TaxID=103762 RepID=A0A8J5RWJ4_ZIZPA|nr:hypothetical protein GUJ93_ZPchr0001g31723 [Zizania palustris]
MRALSSRDGGTNASGVTNLEGIEGTIYLCMEKFRLVVRQYAINKEFELGVEATNQSSVNHCVCSVVVVVCSNDDGAAEGGEASRVAELAMGEEVMHPMPKEDA